jgi:hypothetical protein
MDYIYRCLFIYKMQAVVLTYKSSKGSCKRKIKTINYKHYSNYCLHRKRFFDKKFIHKYDQSKRLSFFIDM